jgi:RNA polymerase-binding transcription factor
MCAEINPEGSRRNTVLRNLLLHLREKELARIKELRGDQAGDTLSEPRDTLEDARADEEFDLHADLLARGEKRLAEIHVAFERLDAGTYGICAKCKREIDLARIRAVPFTALCAACERMRRAPAAEGATSEEFMSHWTVPEGNVERLGQEEPLELPEANPAEIAGETFMPAPAAAPAPVSKRRKTGKRRKR